MLFSNFIIDILLSSCFDPPNGVATCQSKSTFKNEIRNSTYTLIYKMLQNELEFEYSTLLSRVGV